MSIVSHLHQLFNAETGRVPVRCGKYPHTSPKPPER
jgi:hypothetical protein